MQTLVVVGASLAGLSAARAARAQGFAGRLVIIGDEAPRPYDRPPLSKDFLAGKIGLEDLALEEVGEDLNAEWLLGVRAERFDAQSLTVTLNDGRSVTADKVIIATGASARGLAELQGMQNVFTLRTLADAQALRPRLVSGHRLVVIGAGFIGAETASTAKAAGMDVTVVERAVAPLAGPLGAQMGAAVAGLHEAAGVELLCGTGVSSFTMSGTSVSEVVLDNGRRLPSDVVLVGIGAQPNVEWLEGSGIALDNGVLCDAMGRTNRPGVSAVGDCAAWYDLQAQSHQRIEHWAGANERPALAVAALLDENAVQQPVNPPYFWSDQYGSRIQFAGQVRGHDRIEIEHGDVAERCFLAVYYAGAEPVAVLGVDQTRQFTKWRKFLNKNAQQYLVPAGEFVAAS
ncbi:NAD(P)/FAD-dependent oxidoreductase [Arthrobacter crystallopoietes]|uniref:NAD(P)/FAD-dependent oxidoreductase n=1 Tax=Crystallibacter crystallopoietes TaxID=37928 RepID=UPI00111109C8|nr:FAD-dependent oxidoreductase [Arthrobacter crystallopoietes]QTG82357.1 FAD-dependent oxidoreductase [Arthrobacter crystallopoietes]